MAGITGIGALVAKSQANAQAYKDQQAQKAAEAAAAAQQEQIGNYFAQLAANDPQWAAHGAQQIAADLPAQQAAAAAQQAEQQRLAGLDARYGNDLAWTDPSFQMSPSLLTGSNVATGAYADPASIAAQQQSYAGLMNAANTPLKFQSPAAQQALADQWGQISSGKGAPTFMGGAQQQQLMSQLLGVQAPQFQSDAQQQQVYGQAQARAGGQGAPQFMGDQDQRAIMQQMLGQTGSNGLNFDTSGRELEQYGNLNDIVKGGGATAIEMANRQAQRADQESWLRGQREADMQDYAERGLTGSGQELLALSTDRQAAAGRNSLADLQTAKDLEARRMAAIQSAAGLASNMRGETANEQGLLANRTLSALSSAAGLANQIRGDDTSQKQYLDQAALQALGLAGSQANTMRANTASEQLGLNAALQNQYNSAANIAGQMRTQGYNEGTYLDQRALNALQAQSGLVNDMRTQQANESIAQANNTMSGLQSAGALATNARSQSFGEANTRTSALDAVNQLNMNAINSAKAGNTQFLQNSYTNLLNSRNNQAALQMQLNAQVAQGLMTADQRDNIIASQQATTVGLNNAGSFNNAQANYNGTLTGTNAGTSQQLLNQIYGANNLMGQGLGVIGNSFDKFISMGMQAPSSGGSSAGSGQAGTTGGSFASNLGKNDLTTQANPYGNNLLNDDKDK